MRRRFSEPLRIKSFHWLISIFRVEILMRQYYKLFQTKREMLISFKPADYKLNQIF